MENEKNFLPTQFGKEESLNELNFWKNTRDVSPNMTDLFFQWFKSYRLRCSSFVNAGIEKLIQFEHLPFEFQFGILMRFLGTIAWDGHPIEFDPTTILFKDSCIKLISDLFEKYEKCSPAVPRK